MTDPRLCPALCTGGKQQMGLHSSPKEAGPKGPGRLSSSTAIPEVIWWEGVLAIKECHYQDG